MKLNIIVAVATVHINLQQSAKKMKEQKKVLLTPMYQVPSQRHQCQVEKKNRPRGSSPLANLPCSQKEKPCVICGQPKYKKDTKKYGICEVQRAKNFIKSYNFNRDEVYEKCILYKTHGDIFASDIYAHKNCIKRYIKKYLDDIQEFL